MPQLGFAFRDELRRVLRDRKLSASAAASQLGVSRQAFHSYLNASSVPRQKVLARAMRLWDLTLHVGTKPFDKSSFPELKPQSAPAIQMSLLEVLDRIQQDDLKIAVKRVGKSLRVSVSIDIPA
jgi:transcriptional regulator with XRE-family HTH domain